MKCPLNNMRDCDFDCALMVTYDNDRFAGCGLVALVARDYVKSPIVPVNVLVKNGDKKDDR